MKIKTYRVLVTAFVTLLGVGLAHADAITDTNVLFTASVTGTTVTLDIQCLKSAICGNWYLGDVTLKGFTFTGNPTLDTVLPPAYSLINGGQNNDAVGSTTPGTHGCDGTQSGQAVCWDAPSPTLTTKLGSGVITFTANINPTASPGTLHVQATAYDNSAGDEKHGGKVLSVSDDLKPVLTSVPEPDPLVLVASGFLILALVRRRISPYNPV